MTVDLLPKIRSKKLTEAAEGMPCTLRIGTFLGIPCAPASTVVACHLPTIGKGVSTKVSDLYVCNGCRVCHDLLDGVDKRVFEIIDRYPGAFYERLMRAGHETQAYWVRDDLIQIKGARIIG